MTEVNSSGRSDFCIDTITDDVVFIHDMCLMYQRMSVTNDAENVVREVYITYGNKRIMYRDTDGQWDELVHANGVFVTFARGYSPARWFLLKKRMVMKSDKEKLEEIIGNAEWVKRLREGTMCVDDVPGLYERLFEHYVRFMPYGTAKARTGDPIQFIEEQLEKDLV